jgi:hypothetical protein
MLRGKGKLSVRRILDHERNELMRHGDCEVTNIMVNILHLYGII